MSRKHTLKNGVLRTDKNSAARQPSGGPRRIRGWRLWAFRAGLALGIPAVLLALVEGGLRLAGFGYPAAFCLQPSGTADYVENRKFVWQFYSPKTNLRPNPFVVAADKPADTLRVVVLGESAAAGTPDPAYSFGRILERMLRHEPPAG